ARADPAGGPRHQRGRLVSPAGEGVCGAESRRDDRPPAAEPPRSAEVEASLEDPGRAWEIPATELGAAQIEQPDGQREGMIGRSSGLHGGLGVPDGLIEPAELGEDVGEDGPRKRRLEGGRTELRLESPAPPPGGGARLAVLAPGGVRPAEKGRGDHLDRAITEGSRDTQGLLAESDGRVVVASGQGMVHHEGGDPPEPVLVAERPGEPLRLVEVVYHARPMAE